jgi:hypothetical protein
MTLRVTPNSHVFTSHNKWRHQVRPSSVADARHTEEAAERKKKAPTLFD